MKNLLFVREDFPNPGMADPTRATKFFDKVDVQIFVFEECEKEKKVLRV